MNYESAITDRERRASLLVLSLRLRHVARLGVSHISLSNLFSLRAEAEPRLDLMAMSLIPRTQRTRKGPGKTKNSSHQGHGPTQRPRSTSKTQAPVRVYVAPPFSSRITRHRAALGRLLCVRRNILRQLLVSEEQSREVATATGDDAPWMPDVDHPADGPGGRDTTAIKETSNPLTCNTPHRLDFSMLFHRNVMAVRRLLHIQ